MLEDRYRQGMPAYEIASEIPVKNSTENFYSFHIYSYGFHRQPFHCSTLLSTEDTEITIAYNKHAWNFRSSGKTA
jgi:hypothetical protein